MASGADAFIMKPVSFASLAESIKSVILNQLMTLQAVSPQANSIESVARNLGLSEQTARDLIREFFQSLPSYLDSINTACEQEDRIALGSAVHKLKGISLTYGLGSIVNQCERLEIIIQNGMMKTLAEIVTDIQKESLEAEERFKKTNDITS
jgi:HPt (histidine-containing phosphotransfer) domain-containing protein